MAVGLFFFMAFVYELTHPVSPEAATSRMEVGCPTMLACRNRDLGTPAAGERHEERGGRTIEVAAAMVARRLPAACRATRLCCNVMRVGGVGSPELQGIRGCGWLRQKADPSRYLAAIARQCGERR